MNNRLKSTAVLVIASAMGSGALAQEIPFVSLDDRTGATAEVGNELGDAKVEAVKWINARGGINGKKVAFESVDYAYAAPRAVAAYKRWMSANPKPVTIFGYGTADTEALVGFVNDEKIPYFSHSYSAKLTDPIGRSKRVDRPTPYNFFYGATYSDSCRALVRWAFDEWKKKAGQGKPKFVFMGDNHPYPNSPKEACTAFAEQIGFDLVPAIQYSMRGGDFKAQCLTLRESGATFAYLANNAGPNVALLKSCETVGVSGVQYLTNVYGLDENTMKAAGDAADGTMVPLAVTPYGINVPGMKLIQELTGGKPRTPHFIATACTFFYIKEAMEWADKNGGIAPENIRKGMYQKKEWVPAGLEGVCPPATWTETDHRSVDKIVLYRALTKGGKTEWATVQTVSLPRTDEWFAR